MNGFLNIDKPQGLTSRSVVDHINRLLRERGLTRSTLPKVGHAGTLDPLATGVLVVAVGHATRLIELVQSRPKDYRGTFLLGKRSDTDDVTGQVVEGDTARASSITAPNWTPRWKDFGDASSKCPRIFCGASRRPSRVQACSAAKWSNSRQRRSRFIEWKLSVSNRQN